MAYARGVVESDRPAAGARKAPGHARVPRHPVSAHLRWHCVCAAHRLSVERHPAGSLRAEVHRLGPLQAMGGPGCLSAGMAAGAGLLTNGASLYLRKINDLAIEAISRDSKNPRKFCKKRFFLSLSVSVSP